MARLPSREDIRRSRIWEAMQRPKRLKAIGIGADRFTFLLNQLAKQHALDGTSSAARASEISTCYAFWQEATKTKPFSQRRPASIQLLKAREDLKTFVRQLPRGNAKPRFLKLRAKWRKGDPEEQLWKDLLFHCSEYGLEFVESLNRLFIYPWPCTYEFLAEPEIEFNTPNARSIVRTRLKAACLATRKHWAESHNIRRSRPPLTPLREWIVHMANVFVEAGGQLGSRWASYNGTIERHHSGFADFLWQFYRLLPPECQMAKDEAEFAQHVEKAGLEFQAGKLDQPDLSLYAGLRP